MKKPNDLPLYSSRITNTYVEYIQKYYPHVDIDKIFKYAGMTRYEVEDPGHWFTQKQVDRFHEKVVEKTGNPDIARSAGRYTASSERIGPIKQYSLGLITLSTVYQMVEKLYSVMSKGATAKAEIQGPYKVAITVTPNPGTKEKLYQCQNRIGTFESLAQLFAGKLSIINETHCFHKGDKHCRYVIEWEKTPSLMLKLIRNYLFIGIIVAAPVLFFLMPSSIWAIMTLSFISATLLLSSYSEHMLRKELYTTIESQGNAAKELINEINVRHNNALLVQEIGQVTSTIVEVDQLVKDVMHIIMRYLNYDRGMIFMSDAACENLMFHTGIGYNNETKKSLAATKIKLSEDHGNTVISRVFHTQKPCLSNQTEGSTELSLMRTEINNPIEMYAFICVPIIYENESLGILIVENVEHKKQLTQSDMSLLIGVASQVAVGINNARSFQKLNDIKEEIQRSHDDLEIRVDERTAALEKLNQELNMEIEERRKSERRLKTTIKEKDVLIREVHHRVKNNLQVISSLLDMSKRRAKHPETVDLLSEAHAKIFTMSLIHSQLYKSDRFDEINMGRFIRDFVGQLAQLYHGDRNIELNIQAEDIYLSVTQAIPSALALNEIISNAFKHAFTETKNGRVSIIFRKIDHQRIHLNIRDNGIGIPDHIDIDNTETLGLKLIRNLVSVQLKGELEIDCSHGTEINIVLPIIKE
jgi:two-component sensor histidine kinase/predicted hydrocarbon binding protein